MRTEYTSNKINIIILYMLMLNEYIDHKKDSSITQFMYVVFYK